MKKLMLLYVIDFKIASLTGIRVNKNQIKANCT